MAKLNKPTLRIAKLPNLNPVKLTVSLEPEVHQMLEDYARIYGDSYCEAVKPHPLYSIWERYIYIKRTKNEHLV